MGFPIPEDRSPTIWTVSLRVQIPIRFFFIVPEGGKMQVGGLNSPVFPGTVTGIPRKSDNFVSLQDAKRLPEVFDDISGHLISVVDKPLP
jgi:hypothetical protein